MLCNYRPHKRVPHPAPVGHSATKQEFRDDADINRIMAKFQRTGAISHFAKYGATYGDFPACDFQHAQNTLLRARQMYAELPSNIRALYNSPETFLAFVQDPKNLPKMRELGLAKPAAEPAAPAAAAAPETPPTA